MRSFLEVAGFDSVRANFAPVFPDYVEDVVLAADTLVRVPIPTGARFVAFSFNADFRAKLGISTTPLVLPATTTTDGSGSELNPAARHIPAYLVDGTTVPTHLCLRAAAATNGSLVFYG